MQRFYILKYEKMNFQTLKWMLEWLIQTYKCPNCNSAIVDNNIDIVGTAGKNMNLDVECPNCKIHSIVKAEMLPINFSLNQINISKESLGDLKNNLSKFKNHSSNNNNLSLKDEEIIALNKELKELKSVSDLFNDK